MNLRRVVVVALLATIALPVSAPAFAADAPLPSSDPAVGATGGIAWLRAQLGDDGAVRGATGAVDLNATRTTALALALSGDDGAHIDAALGVLSADLSPLTNADGPVAGAVGQMLQLVALTGGDPHDVGGTDLVELLVASQRTAPDADAGLYGAQSPAFDGAFRQAAAIIGLALSGDTSDIVLESLANATSWLADQQCADGSWLAHRADTTAPCPAADPTSFSGPDTNSTGAATVALQLLDHPIIDPTAYFEANQGTDGGWAFFAGADQPSDANSTAWVIRARRALGLADDPDTTAMLLSLQLGCDAEAADQGAFIYAEAFPGASQLATVDAVPALALLAGEVGTTNPCVEDTTTTTTTTAPGSTTTTTTTVPSEPSTPTSVAAATAAPATPVPTSRVTFAG